MKEAYIPAPSRKAARLVVHTPRMRIIVMSISGLRERISTSTHMAVTTRPAAIRPRALAEPQPQLVVSLTASRTVERPTVIRKAAPQLMRPGTRTGDSGM